MSDDAQARIREIESRISLAGGSPTLLIAVTNDGQNLADARRALSSILGASGLRIRDLGAFDPRRGPTAWNDAAREEPADAFVLSVAPTTRLAETAFARMVNSQRESLRELAGPMLLLLPRPIEALLREKAPDFTSWASQTWELPTLEELAGIAASRGVVAARVTEPADVAPPIRFLHLSDLHLRPSPTRRYDQNKVLRGLLSMLEQERASAQLDLIFVTGDLAHGGKSSEYEVVVAFLTDLLRVTGVAPEHLFVVPGNHDVDRDVGRWLLRTLDSDNTSTEFFVEAPNRRWHAEKFEAWQRHLSVLLGGRLCGMGVGGDAVEVVDVRGVKIAVASFNTAWFAQGSDDAGKLWLGEANVAEAVRKASHAPFTIAVMHHPLEQLADVERDVVENHVERGFDILLRGHLHRERTRVSHGARGVMLEVAAPAAYQGSQWPNGCFLGEIRARARTVRLRSFVFGNGADPWVVDARVFPDDAADGYAHTYRLGDRVPTSEASAAIEKRAGDAYWSLDRSRRLDIAKRLGVTGTSNREMEERAAALVEKSPEGAEVWRELASSASVPGREVAARSLEELIVGEVIKDITVEKIPQSDPSLLEKAFLAIARLGAARILRALDELRGTMDVQVAFEIVVLGLFKVLIDGPVERAPRGSGADILIGNILDPSKNRAIVEMKVMTRRGGNARLREALIQLDHSGFDAAQRGLLIFCTDSNAAVSRKGVQRMSTPGGREVLVLEL